MHSKVGFLGMNRKRVLTSAIAVTVATVMVVFCWWLFKNHEEVFATAIRGIRRHVLTPWWK